MRVPALITRENVVKNIYKYTREFIYKKYYDGDL